MRLKKAPSLIAGAALVLALPIARQPLARALETRAIEARKGWRLDEAERMARWSVALGSSEAKIETAEILLLEGETRRALSLLETLHSGGSHSPRAATLLGMARFQSNDSRGSIESFEQAIDAARAEKNDILEARARVGLSRVLYYTQGRSDDARNHLEYALAVARRRGDLQLEADATRHLGVIRLWFDSDAESATRDFFEPALALYRKAGDRHGEAATLGNIGLGERIVGRLTGYYEHQKASMEIATEIGDRAGVAQSLAALGSLQVSTQNYRKAREYLERSLALSHEIGHAIAENDSADLLVGVLLVLEEFDEARAHLTSLVERNRANPLLAKYEMATLSDCHFRTGDTEKALEVIRESLRLDAEIGQPDHRFTFSMHIRESEALTRLGRLQEAEEAIEAAKAAGPAIELGWEDHLQPALSRAELLAAQQDHDGAIEQLERAADTDLARLSSNGSRFAELPDQRVYDRLFAFLLDGPPGDEAAVALAWRFLEQLRYRSFQSVIIGGRPWTVDPDAAARVRNLTRTLLQNERGSERSSIAYAELENQLLHTNFPSSAAVQGGTPAQVRLRDLQNGLDADSAIIEYVMTRDRAWGILITHDRLDSRALPAEPSAIFAKIHLLRSLFDREALEKRWQPVARDLHRILIEPLAIPSEIDRLRIIPYAFLRDVPFAALADDEGFLVERYAISTATSASRFAGKPTSARIAGRGLSFGLSDVSRSGLPKLALAEDEARKVARLSDGEILCGKDASEATLKQQARPIPFLHVATHAVIEPDMPLLGRLELAAGDGEDGSFTVPEILELGLRADMVTLSACRTSESHSASGRPTSEVDRIGLLDAFLLAGARSVVASLLPVSDRAASVLMGAFYKNLRTMPRSEALAQAQLALIAGDPVPADDFSHPRYWAPFVLIGDDR